MYIIKHEYTTDGGFGDAISTEGTIGIVETETEAKEYCDRWENEHEYDQPYATLCCGQLTYYKIPLINDLSKPPHEYSESAAWAFDKDNDYYCDLETEWESIEDALRKYRSQGMTTRDIARKLGIPESSVRTYIKEGK